MPVKKIDGFTRVDAFTADPDRLTIVLDKTDPLYDQRAEEPACESLVRNILKRGVKQPVLVVRRGNEYAVVDGRRRVVAAREANRRSKEEGGLPIRVPVRLEYAHEAGDLLGILITCNENRKDDGPIQRAEKVRRYLDYGRSEDNAAVEFGVSKMQIKKLLALLTLAPEIMKGIQKGIITATAAMEFAGLGHDEQRAAMQRVAADTPKKKKVSIKAAASAAGKPKQVLPKMKEVIAILADDMYKDDFKDGVRWARGIKE